MDDSVGSDSVSLEAVKASYNSKVKRRSVHTAISYSLKDSRRRWGSYALDIFVIAMVCFVLVLMRGISSRTPVLYTNFAERRVGEGDLLLQPNPAAAVRKSPGSPLPDICDCDDLVLGNFLPVRSLGPVLTRIQSSSENMMGFFSRNLFLASVAGKEADRSSSSRVTLMFYDHDKEDAINVGKRWHFRKLGEQEAFANDVVLRLINVVAAMGERADLTIELSIFLSILDSVLSARGEPILFSDNQMALLQKDDESYIGIRVDAIGAGDTDDTFSSNGLGVEVVEGNEYLVMSVNQAIGIAFGGDAAQLATEVAIADSVAGSGGKWSSALGNVVALEKAHFELLLRDILRKLRESNEFTVQDLEKCFQVVVPDPEVPSANGFSRKQWLQNQARFEQSCGTDATSRSLETIREDFVSLRQGPLGELFQVPPSLGQVLRLIEDIWRGFGADSPLSPALLEECIAPIFVNLSIDMLTNSTKGMNVEDFTSQVIVLHEQRSDLYSGGLQSSRRQLSALADEVSVALGVDYAVNITTPVLDDLEFNEVVSILIDQIFFIVFVCIMLLTTLLLFSIATFDADKRSYEYAMLRTLGLRTKELIIMVVSKGLQITIPALLLGLAFALLGLLLVDLVLESVAGGEVDLNLDAGFFIVAVLAGFVIPFLAHTLPSRMALAKSLNTAIDISRHKQSEMKVVWKNPRKFNVEFLLVIVGLVLVTFGAIFFYGIPRSFNDGNLSLFLGLLNVIIMGMLFSLSVIVQLLSPLCERAFSYILMPPGTRDARMRSVVMRQLFTHRPKTRNSSIMYTIALGFFIFSGSLVLQQSLGINIYLQEFSGSDVRAFRVDSEELNVDAINPVLDNLVERGVVEDFTFVTPPARIGLSQVVGEGLGRLRVYGLQDNFFKVVPENLVQVHQTAADYSSIRDLDDFFLQDSGAVPRAFGDVPYSDRLPSILSGRSEEVSDDATPILIGAASALEPAIGVSTGVPLLATRRENFAVSHASVLFTKVPTLFFSGLQAVAGETSVLVSENKFGELLGNSNDGSKKESLLIKLRGDSEEELRSNSLVVEGSLYSSVEDELVVLNAVELLDSVSTVSNSLNVYFIIIGIVSIVLCFVMLWTTVAANVSEGKWELAVMRSIGFTKLQIIRVHVYENLLQVFTSTILGTASGVLVSLTLALQYSIFQERPPTLPFPWALFFLLVGLSLLTAIIAPAVIVSNTYVKGIAATLRSI